MDTMHVCTRYVKRHMPRSPIDEIRDRRQRDLESGTAAPSIKFEEHRGCGTVATARELCAAALLGLETEFSVAHLRSSFKRHALLAHPDKGGDQAAFQRLVRAYTLLKKRACIKERTVRDVELERTAPLPQADRSYGDLERDFKAGGHGDWLRGDASPSTRPPERVAFKDFHKVFDKVRNCGAGAIVKHRVTYLPFQSSLAPCNIHEESGDCAGSGQGYSDLVTAYMG